MNKIISCTEPTNIATKQYELYFRRIPVYLENNFKLGLIEN